MHAGRSDTGSGRARFLRPPSTLVAAALLASAWAAVEAAAHQEAPEVDVNQDGRDDLFLYIPFLGGTVPSGGFLALPSGAAGFDEPASALFTPQTLGLGNPPRRRLGASHLLGDVDCNGSFELLVGAPSTTLPGKASAGGFDLFADPLAADPLEFYNLGPFAKANDRFGFSFARGAVGGDSDGCRDVLVGSPGRSNKRGGVTVYFDEFSRFRELLGPSTGREFGFSLAAGRVNGDALDDILVGAPGSNDGAGAVYLFHGGSKFFSAKPIATFQQGQGGIFGPAKKGNRFGEAVALGDFDGVGGANVVIGSRRLDFGSAESGGAVSVRRQNGTWLSVGLGSPHAQFGAALAVGDIDGNGFDDLCIGAPGLAFGSIPRNGAFYCYAGSPAGLAFHSSAQIDPASIGQAKGLGLGETLRTGDFLGRGYDQIAVGAPCFDLPGKPNAGAVILYDPKLRTFVGPILHLDAGQIAGTAQANDYLGGTSDQLPELCGTN